MSTFVKNYYSPKNPDLYLAVSWETGYRNIQVFHNGRLVHTINQPSALIKGVKIQDEELGKIKFRFTDVRPRKLEIKVNNRKFKTVNNYSTGYDYSGLVTLFTSLALLACIESFIIGGLVRFDFSFPLVGIYFAVGLAISLIYGVTAYLLSKRVNWSYFVGTGIFTITTLVSAIGVTTIFAGFFSYLILFFRLGMLIYLYVQMKHILGEMKKTQAPNQDDVLLDS